CELSIPIESEPGDWKGAGRIFVEGEEDQECDRQIEKKIYRDAVEPQRQGHPGFAVKCHKSFPAWQPCASRAPEAGSSRPARRPLPIRSRNGAPGSARR